MDEQLRIVIDALNKATDDIKNVKKEIGGLDETTKKADKTSKGFGESWAGVLTGLNAGIAIAQQAAAAVKKIYETAREGAEIEYLQSRFDNLTTSINTTANALLTDMKDATDGMYSDAELMASATDFMSLGLAKSHDEVVRLAKVSGALNMNMNQLVLTLTNQTTMRFDALGVSVDGFDAKVKALKASGLSAAEAFNEAFLQQAEEQIDRVGSATDESIGDFMRLEAAFDNLAASAKANLTQTVAPAIKWLADSLTEMSDSVNTLDAAYARGIITELEYYQLKNKSRTITGSLAGDIEYLTGKIIAYDTAIERSAQLSEDWALANDQGYAASHKMATGIEEMNDSLVPVNIAMQELNTQLLYSIATQDLTADQAFVVAEAMGLVNEDTVAAYMAIGDLRDQMDGSQESLDDYAGTMGDLARFLEIMPKNVDVTVTTTYLEVMGRTSGSGYSPVRRETRAAGGPVSANTPYIWQEYRGGEVMVPSQNGYVLSRADAENILSRAAANHQTVNNFYLTMPTSNNPTDVISAYETMKVMIGA